MPQPVTFPSRLQSFLVPGFFLNPIPKDGFIGLCMSYEVGNRLRRKYDLIINDNGVSIHVKDFKKHYSGIRSYVPLAFRRSGDTNLMRFNKKPWALYPWVIPPERSRQNLHNVLDITETKDDPTPIWKDLSFRVRKEAGFCCVICGRQHKTGAIHLIDAHEVWSYEYRKNDYNIQRLERIDALCRDCHDVQHLNHYLDEKDKERYDQLCFHIRYINGPKKTDEDVRLLIRYMLEQKPAGAWITDYSYATKTYGVEITNQGIAQAEKRAKR